MPKYPFSDDLPKMPKNFSQDFQNGNSPVDV